MGEQTNCPESLFWGLFNFLSNTRFFSSFDHIFSFFLSFFFGFVEKKMAGICMVGLQFWDDLAMESSEVFPFFSLDKKIHQKKKKLNLIKIGFL